MPAQRKTEKDVNYMKSLLELYDICVLLPNTPLCDLELMNVVEDELLLSDPT